MDSPSAERNKEPIWGILDDRFFSKQQEDAKEIHILEIAAGSGVHSHFFSQQLVSGKSGYKFDTSTVKWFPTDPSDKSLRSIATYLTDVPGILQPPLPLTLNKEGIMEKESVAAMGGEGSFDLILCINTIHIAPWEATIGLMKEAKRLLKPGSGMLYCYGPYKEGGVAVESNLYVPEHAMASA